MKKFLIGITGGTGSGKSYFSELIQRKIHNQLALESTIFDQDNYFFDEPKQPRDKNGHANFDTPQSLDLAKYRLDFEKIVRGDKVIQRRYNYNKPIEDGKYEVVFKPNPVIIFEGIFSIYQEDIFERQDLTVFMDAEFETKIRRRIIRDREQRGYDEEDVRYKFSQHIKSSYHEHILPIREKCNMVIENNTDANTLASNAEKVVEDVKRHFKIKN
ncbi:MAG TPA: hypothetical protein VJ911_04650 [Cryomorphaceae bacterium]|nr:hypothetical protein [Cryomorphaceae bacterium]